MDDQERFALLEKRLQASETRLKASEEKQAGMQRQVQGLKQHQVRLQRRLFATWASACIGILFAFVLGVSPQARAQAGGPLAEILEQLAALTQRVSTLETQVAARDTRLTTVEGQVSTLGTQVTALNDKTQYVSVSGTDMIITGANLHIRSGSGATNGDPSNPSTPIGTVNGLGNLIIGYNESAGTLGDERGGSHNLVIGIFHDYTSFGGMVVGRASHITAPYASVSGGANNTASSFYSSVSGGYGNTASGNFSSVSGGYVRTAPDTLNWAAGSLLQDY